MPKFEWNTSDHGISRFSESDSGLLKEIFESNQSLSSLDPTFGMYPDTEYRDLISRDRTDESFFLRRIDSSNGEACGYFQLETNTPEPGVVWLPMFVLRPEFQGRGLGRGVMDFLFAELTEFTFARLNVYAENLKAFKFWYRQGFSKIITWEAEKVDGVEYQCLTLEKELPVTDSRN